MTLGSETLTSATTPLKSKFLSVVTVVLVAFLLALGCSSERRQNANTAPGWGRVVVDPTPLLGNRRQQIADISHGGARRFAVAYIVSPNPELVVIRPDGVSGVTLHDEPPPEPFEEAGSLRLAHFDVETGLRSQPQVLAGMEVAWVRAMTGGPVERPGCPLVVQPAAAPAASATDFPNLATPSNPEFISFFSYGALDGGIAKVRLLRTRWCNGFQSSHLDLAEGKKPSLAVGRRDEETKILVVYSRGNELLGLFVDLEGAGIAPELRLATLDQAFSVASTDVIWNSPGDHFIVGYMQNRGGIDIVHPDFCSVRNVRVTWSGGADEPRVHGACDPERGGHHTSVDIDDRADVNPDGIYAWWYQGIDDGKGVRFMTADGDPTGVRSELTQSGWTYPVTARHDKLALPSAPQLFGARPGSYIVAARPTPFSGVDQRLSAWSFETDGTRHTFGRLGSTPHKTTPVAIEALDKESVSLWRCCTGEVPDTPNGFWGLTVFAHTVEQVFIDPGN